MLYIVLFISGLFFGSFLNVLADRLSRNKSLSGRSECDYCHKTLSWKDLIPVISFVWLRGRCRYCHKRLSIQYPIAEFLTGLLFAFVFWFVMVNGQWSIVNLVYYLTIISSLIVIFFADLRYGIIPDKIVFSVASVSAIFLLLTPDLLPNHLLAGFFAIIFFAAIYMLTKGRGIGMGDVKLAFLIGLFLGLPYALFASYVAFLTGGVVALILILWKKKTLKSTLPFGPFLVIGTLLSFFLQSLVNQLVLRIF